MRRQATLARSSGSDLESRARDYQLRQRNATHHADGTVGEDEDEDDDGIEEDHLREIMEANEDLDAPSLPATGLFTMPGRDLIDPPERGDDLTTRHIQEQRNAASENEAVDGRPEDILIEEPPTGPSRQIIIPATLEHALGIYDAMVASTRRINRHLLLSSSSTVIGLSRPLTSERGISCHGIV